MNPKMSKTSLPKENIDKKEQLRPIAEYSRTNLSAEVVPVTENKEKVNYTKNLRTIDKGNILGGAPGRVSSTPNPERTRKAVQEINEKYHPETVITFETPGDYKGDPASINAEKEEWAKLGVKVIELRTEETDLLEFFQNTENHKAIIEAFKALDKGTAFIHCTFGMHRAVAFTEIWRATRGINRIAAIDANKDYNSSKGHRECREQAKHIIGVLYEANKKKKETTEAAPVETQETPMTLQETAQHIALIGDSIGKGISDSGIKKYFKKYKRFAIGGRWTYNSNKTAIYRQLEDVDPEKAPFLVIQGGTNDLHGGVSPETVAQNLKKLYLRAKERGFKKIFVVTIPSNIDSNMKKKYRDSQLGTKAMQTNALLREMAKNGGIELYDLDTEYKRIDPNLGKMAPDGVHFSGRGSFDLSTLILNEMKDRVSGSKTTINLANEVGESLQTGQTPAIPGYESIYSAFATTEHVSPESKKLQETLQKELEKISPTIREKDLEKIKNSTIKDLRFNVGLLNGKKENVKEEMKRRLAQYTDTMADGGLRINYLKFNELTGQDHEMGIGLGDIMPPQYTKILIITEDGRQRLGERGIVDTSSGPRVGYRDTATGEYLATFTGDMIYVLDPPLTDEAKLKELLAQEASTRGAGESSYDSYEATRTSRGYDLPPETYSGEEYEKTGGMQENPKLKNYAIRNLNRHIRANGKFWNYKGVKINIPINGEQTALWEYNSSLSEGENIYNYSKAVCKAHGMENMISAVWGIVKAESGCNPFNAIRRSSATGLGQPMETTWRSFIPKALSSKDPFIKTMIRGQRGKGVEFIRSGLTGTKHATLEKKDLASHTFSGKRAVLNYSRCNPYLNIYSVIMGIKSNITKYETYHRKHGVGVRDFGALSTPDQLRLLYLSHHDGGAGGPAQLAFMIHLQKDLGIDITNRELVRRFIASGSPESKKAQKLLCGRQGRRIYRRAINREDSCLRSWYRTCSVVVRAALGTNYQRTSLPDLDGIRRSASTSPSSASSSSEPETAGALPPTTQQIQQPRKISKNTPLIHIPTIDKTKFPGKTAILVLGNGPNAARNKYRAQVGAEISLKMREVGLRPQLICSGGATKRRISEAQEQINHLASNPRYIPLLTEKDNPVGREKQSGNTGKNISNTIGHLRAKGFQNVIVVSSEPGENHGRRGARNLRKKDKTMNITFWEPETPDINNNFIGPTNFAQRNEPSQPVQEVKSSVEKEETEKEKIKLSTTDLLRIFKSKDKTKINEIIAQYGYPSLKDIQTQLANTPAGAFVEDPSGVLRGFEGSQPLLTFDICSNYGRESTNIVLEFLDNAMKKQPPVPVMLFVTGKALSNPRIRAAIEEASQYNHISIQNHGFKHKPLSTTSGKEIYNVKGNSSIEEAYYEVTKGAILTESITGKRPKYYRSSTLYADSRGIEITKILGIEVLGRTKGHGDHQRPGTEQAGSIVLRHAKKPSSIKYLNNVRDRMRKGKLNLAKN
jgi:hypothetical protein